MHCAQPCVNVDAVDIGVEELSGCSGNRSSVEVIVAGHLINSFCDSFIISATLKSTTPL